MSKMRLDDEVLKVFGCRDPVISYRLNMQEQAGYGCWLNRGNLMVWQDIECCRSCG